MKNTYILIILLLSPLWLFAQDAITLNTANTAGGTIEACEGITLAPGFSFTAATGKSMTLSINRAVCTPRQEIISGWSNQNYIVTVTPLDESSHVQIANGTVSIDRDSRALITVQYFDGLGRPVQTVQKGAGPQGQDIVTALEYDGFGREWKSYLPVPVANNNGAFASNVPSLASVAYAGDLRPFSETVYEPSPLNRPLENYGPGEVWKTDSRSVKTGYLTNTSTGHQSCRQYEMSGDNFKLVGNYAPGQLYVHKTTNEDNHDSYEFTNRLGQVVLQRRIDSRKTTVAEQQYDTYYIYDDFGNLRYVLPPMASDGAGTAGTTYTPTSQVIAYFAYVYRYDNRQRRVEKKLPGVEWVYMVYDRADRLRLIQDGVQRSRNEWTYHKYDALGRQIITGTFIRTATLAQMQTNLNAVTTLFESLSTNHDNTYMLYTNNSYPRSSDGTGMKELIALYYDNYDFVRPGGTLTSDLAFTANVSDAEHSSAKGLPTGSRSALLDEWGQRYIYRHTRYDTYGRPVQVKSTNTIENEMDFEFYKYNFTGQVIEKNIRIKSNIVSEKYTYEYDNKGRLLKTLYSLNNGTPVTMASYTYDPFGRVNGKNIGGLDNTTYSYNLRSWQTKQTSSRFTEELFYTSCIRTDVPGQFGGNIIAKQWKTIESADTRGMTYVYDPLNRLTNAGTGDGSSLLSPVDKYGEHIEYDKNGNFLWVVRNGRFDNGTHAAIDVLAPQYKGNQLWKLVDGGVTQAASDLMEFRQDFDKPYEYDANGRLIADPHKKITNIEYNFVNLPHRITIQGGSWVEYTYDAMGTKFNAVYLGMNNSIIVSYASTRYAANKLYNPIGQVKGILTEEGYVENLGNTYSHHYYLKDYQGNNRMVINSSGAIVQATNYYPFGASYAENPARTDQYVQPYKYNGKELDRLMGLDYYDYAARVYDPVQTRFTTMDPLAEMYYSISPYVYVANNPINAIDPDGRLVIFINGMHRGTGETANYWNGFDNAAMKHLNDNNVLYIDGSVGGWSNISNNRSAAYRMSRGQDRGKLDAANIVKLISDSEGNLIETIKIITHSMGAAYAKGYIKSLLEYFEKNNISTDFLEFEADFAPYQPTKQRAVDGVDTYQFSHSKDWVAGNRKMEGANYIDTSFDRNQTHWIQDFMNQIKNLPAGSYKVVDGQIVPY